MIVEIDEQLAVLPQPLVEPGTVLDVKLSSSARSPGALGEAATLGGSAVSLRASPAVRYFGISSSAPVPDKIIRRCRPVIYGA